MKDEYYIHDKSRGCVGNSMVWWKYNNCGYVCDIREAKVWTKEEAQQVINDADDLEMWPKDYIDERVQHHIDTQSVNKRDINQ